jgi:hypothetical protein
MNARECEELAVEAKDQFTRAAYLYMAGCWRELVNDFWELRTLQ